MLNPKQHRLYVRVGRLSLASPVRASMYTYKPQYGNFRVSPHAFFFNFDAQMSAETFVLCLTRDDAEALHHLSDGAFG